MQFSMRAIASLSHVRWFVCLRVCVSVRLYVCLSVCLLGTPVAVQKRMNRSRCRLRQTLVGLRNHLLDKGVYKRRMANIME